MDQALRDELEKHAPEKSQFIRTAIREKIERTLGEPEGKLSYLDAPPSRAGKGGQPTHRNLSLNDAASSISTKQLAEAAKVNYKSRSKAKH